MRAGSVGEVIKVKNHPKFKVGELYFRATERATYVGLMEKANYKVDSKHWHPYHVYWYLGHAGIYDRLFRNFKKWGKIKEGECGSVSGGSWCCRQLIVGTNRQDKRLYP